MRHRGKLGLALGFILLLSLLTGCGTPTATNSPIPPVASPTSSPVTPTTLAAPTAPTPTVSPAVVNPTPAPTITAASSSLHNGMLKEIFPGLANLTEVTKGARLETGLGDMGLSSDLDYKLKLDGSGLHGIALFEAYFYVAKFNTFEDARQINVPPDAASQFLDNLALTPLEEGPYKETAKHISDYYPFLSFELETGLGILSFSSDSQEDDFSPWRVTFAGRNFYANNGVPLEAYNLIKPYLKTEVIKEMSNQFSQTIDQKWNIEPRYTIPQPVSPLKQLKEGKYTSKDLGYAYAFNTATNLLAVPTYKDGSAVQLLNSNLEPVKDLEKVSGPSLTNLTFSQDGKYLAGIFAFGNQSGLDPSICVWNVASGKLLVRLAGHPRIAALAFSQNDKTLVSASADRTVRVWSLPDGKNTQTLQAAFPEIYSFRTVAISPDGTRIAAGGDGNVYARQFPIKVWDLSKNQAETTLHGHAAPLAVLAFSPDGKTLLSGDKDGDLRQWNTTNWQQLGDAPVAGVPSVITAAYSPDGKSVLAAYQDGGMRLWNASGLKLLSLTVAEPIQKDAYWTYFQAFFSADGRSILSYNNLNYESLHSRLWSVN